MRISNIDEEQYTPKRLQISHVGTKFPSSDEVRVSVTTARSLVANDSVWSAEPSARRPDASDSVRSVDNAVLNPHPTVFRPHATDLVRSAITSDVPDISNATDVVRRVNLLLAEENFKELPPKCDCVSSVRSNGCLL